MYRIFVSIHTSIPAFVTSKVPIEYVGKYRSGDRRDNKMMPLQWEIFQFYHQIPQAQKLGRCFAELALLSEMV